MGFRIDGRNTELFRDFVRSGIQLVRSDRG